MKYEHLVYSYKKVMIIQKNLIDFVCCVIPTFECEYTMKRILFEYNITSKL